MKLNGKRGKGFTLVEILIVVVILGILAAIVVPQFTNAANEARSGNVFTQTSTIETQLELFAARNDGTYPDLGSGGDDDWGVGGIAGTMIGDGYLKTKPINPFNGLSTVGTLTADNPEDADAEADVADPSTSAGWLYNQTAGLIRAPGADYLHDN